jgi:hypothetical protein
MRLHHTTAPGYPTRGLFGPVPMFPEGGEGGGASSAGAEKKAEAKADTKAAAEPPAKVEAKQEDEPPAKVEAKQEAKAEPEKKAQKPEPKAEPKRKIEDLERDVEARLEALNTRLERQREKAVVSELRRLGADPEVVSDADLLALVGKVDPDDPAGAKALMDFKKSRPKWFKAAPKAPHETINEFSAQLKSRGLAKEKIEARARMAAKLGGNQ